MACLDSGASNTKSFLAEDDYTNPEIDGKLDVNKGKEMEVDGKILKEGKINVQGNFEEWTQCHIVITEKGVYLSHEVKQEVTHKDFSVSVSMEFSSAQEVGIVMLPDNARRSRESKLFPFAVRRKPAAEDKSVELMNDKKSIINGIMQQANADEIILATSNGREMWEWATCIQWLGKIPKEEEIPLFEESSSILYHNEHYDDAEVLQNVLLKIFAYKNLPKEPVTFDEVVRIDREQNRSTFPYWSIFYPANFFLQSNVLNDDGEPPSTEYYQDSSEEVEDDIIMKNHAHVFGLFAYIVLVGSCVHVNEKCFELITSSNLFDISSQVTWKGNSPLSMLCEGDYKSSRNYMVKALWKLGYPKVEGYNAGFCDQAFSLFVAKPVQFYGAGNVVGGPVHPEDQKLCRYLRDEGDGRTDNKKLSNQLIEASIHQFIEIEAEHERRITAILIPESVMDWGCTLLTKLNLSGNGIFELPEELYDFTSLTHLNLSSNCLFRLSHRLGNLTNLQIFHIEQNSIEELPYTIENLQKISNFRCFSNPIITPPSAVWSSGIANVRNFFRDMRESGTEINVDLRVLVLGLSEAGKTSLINGMIHPHDVALTRIGDRTVGIEKRTWAMERSEEKQPVNLLTYDFAGQEEYYITHHLFLGSKALYIIAFDLSKTEPTSLDKPIMLWWDSIQNRVCNVKSNDSKTPKIILVGTHADMVDNAQSCADAIHKSLAGRFQLRKKGLRDRLKVLKEELKNLDPRETKLPEEAAGKQRKLTGKVTEEQKVKEYEILSAEKKAQIFSLKSEIKKLQHEQQCTIVLPNTIQAVSSKDLCNFDALKEQIASSFTEVGPSGKYFPHLDVPLPSSWFQVRRLVRQQSAQQGSECMKLPKYFKLLSDELDINEDIGRRATKFCHDLGDVLFFEKEDLVFLQPSFLIDIFKCVIRHDHKESTYWGEKMLDHDISEEQFNRGKDLLLQKGELEQWLLEVLWSRLYDDFPESSITNNFIQLLETFDIGTFVEQKGCKTLLIPEFQPKTLNKEWPTNKDESAYEIQRWISLDQKLPHGLLKRIQVRVFKKVFKRSGTHAFYLAQNEFCIIDKNLSKLYCMGGKRPEEYTGIGTSEGIQLYIHGSDKDFVMSLLSKVYVCLEQTLNDYPGLVFDHYVVHAIRNGSSFIRLEEIKAMQATGETKIHVSIHILNGLNKADNKHIGHKPCSILSKAEDVIVDITDLLPSQPKIEKLSFLPSKFQ